MSRLIDELKKKFRTPKDAITALGLDASILTNDKEMNMSKPIVLSRKATLAQGVLMGFLRPKIAQDTKLDFLPSLLKDVTGKNFSEKKSAIVAGVTEAIKSKLATGMALDALPGMVDQIEQTPIPEGNDLDPNSGLPMSAEEMHRKTMDAEETPGEAEKFLKSKLSAEDWAAYDNLRARDRGRAHDAESEEEKKAREDREAHDRRARDAEMEDKVDKKAMDEALKVTREAAVKETKAALTAIREAEKFVRPWVGEIAIACDSAVDVCKAALKVLAVDGVEKVNDLDALKAIIKAQPMPGAKKASTESMAQDASVIGDYEKMFPGASRIGIL